MRRKQCKYTFIRFLIQISISVFVHTFKQKFLCRISVHNPPCIGRICCTLRYVYEYCIQCFNLFRSGTTRQLIDKLTDKRMNYKLSFYDFFVCKLATDKFSASAYHFVVNVDCTKWLWIIKLLVLYKHHYRFTVFCATGHSGKGTLTCDPFLFRLND